MGVVRDVTVEQLAQAVGGIDTSGLAQDSTLQAVVTAINNISGCNDPVTNTTVNTLGKDTTLQNIASAISRLGAMLGSDRALIDGSNIANPSAFRSAIGISSIFTTKELLSVSNVPTTATSYNLIDSYNNYLLIMLSILYYDNVREELTVTSNYLNNTSAGLRPTVSYQLANLAIDVYKNGNNAVYVKANSAQSNYKLVITGICKIN